MEEGLYDYLVAQSAITDIVSTRVYQGNAPQGVSLPYLVCNMIAVEDMADHGGGSGLARTTIQIDCYEDSYADAKTLASAVRGELHTFSNGSMGSQFVRVCLLQSTRDDITPPSDASETPIYGVSMDFLFVHPVSVPSFA